MNLKRPAQGVRNDEQGYILAGVIILLAVFMILMSIVLPKLWEEIRRDREVETIRRGQQYVRALQLFYRRFHRYPVNIEELEDTNGLRFLRKRYSDPLTRSDDWMPVYQGQNKAPLSMGFFGSVLNAGAAIPAISQGQGRDSILGTPPPSAFDSFSPGSLRSDAASQQPSFSGPSGIGAVIGIRPSKSMASIIVYKTKTNYDEWEFVYDPATDPLVPRWGGGSPYTGAPGMGPSGP